MFYRLMKVALVVCVSFVSASVFAAQTSELNETMKKIGLAYKQLVKAQTIETASSAVVDMQMLIEKSRALGFKKDKEVQSLEGLKQVDQQLEFIKTLLAQNELQQAQLAALKIDTLRKEYHKLHEPPGFWELLFGK
jgi:soluble cytochrome b562